MLCGVKKKGMHTFYTIWQVVYSLYINNRVKRKKKENFPSIKDNL